jgi:hypothetical protein
MISVVIPLYNKASTIAAAVGSVQAQTCRDWRLIVVDDGSRDGGAAWVEAAAANDPRITLVRQSNAGVSVARNRGVAQADTELVAFLDADDQWLPDHLSQLMSLHAWQPDAPLWAAAYRLVDDVGGDRVVHTRVDAPEGRYLIEDYFSESVNVEFPVHSSAVMVSKAALQGIGGFPPGVGSGEDLLTWARLSCLGDIPFGTRATAVYMAPPVSPDVRASVVRRPVSPDVVAQCLLQLAAQHPQKANSIDLFLGLWWRIRAMAYLELNQRVASLLSLRDAVRVSGLRTRDLVCMALCVLPHGVRTQVLAHGRGHRRA